MSKDAGFKVVTHMMPDLPNVDFERDVEQFIEFFENPAFRPDGMFCSLLVTERVPTRSAVDIWVEGRSNKAFLHILPQKVSIYMPKI